MIEMESIYLILSVTVEKEYFIKNKTMSGYIIKETCRLVKSNN